MEFYSNIIHFGAVSYARDKDTSKSLLHPALALLPFVFRRKGNGIAKYISSLCPIKTCLFLNFYIQTKPLKSVLYSHQQKKKNKTPPTFLQTQPKTRSHTLSGTSSLLPWTQPPRAVGRTETLETDGDDDPCVASHVSPPPPRVASPRAAQPSRESTDPPPPSPQFNWQLTHARAVTPRCTLHISESPSARQGRQAPPFLPARPATPPPGEEKHGEGAVLREGGVEEGEVDEGGGREAGEVHTGERGRRVEVDAQECRPAALRQELQASVDQLPPGRPQEGEHLAPGGGHHPQPPRHTRQQVVPSYFAPPLLQSAWFIYLYTRSLWHFSVLF